MVQNNPFGIAVLQGQNFARDVLADRNVTVDVISVDYFDAHLWSSTREDLIAMDYDAITFFGIGEALQPVVDRGVEAGILMYSFNTEPGNDSLRQAWFGQSGFEGGAQVGQKLVDLMEGEGQFGIITGDFAVLGHEERRLGARSVTDEQPGMELVGEWMNNDLAEEAYAITNDMIVAFPDLRGIYVTAGGPSGAARAIANAGLGDQIILVCHDVLDASAPYIADGYIKAALDQDPFNQGFQPVVAAFNYLVTGEAPPDQTFFEGVIAVPETVRELFPELF
jgi:ABC-type sugar transport system substrate-binding protein